MPSDNRIEVSSLIDGTGINAFNISLTIFAFFIMLFDGYDVSSMAFAGASIVKLWHLPGKGALGPVFSASLFGMLFGAPLLGWLGDRAGRKIAVAVSCVIIGCASLSTCFAGTLWQLWAVRFVTGLGMGGLAPNMISLVAEYAPKRFRATMVICMYTGITLGGALVGAIAAALVAEHGWQALFLIGGVGPLIMAVLVLALLPESIKFLVVKRNDRQRAGSLLAKFTGRAFGPEVSFYLVDDAAVTTPTRAVTSPTFLFKNGLAMATITLWLCMACGLMGYYFLMNWMPILLEQVHVAPKTAALATSIFQVGGTLGGLTLSRFIDRRGVGAIVMLFGGAVPVVCCIGYMTGTTALLFLTMFLAGFCALGIQFGVNAVASIIYPTYCRAYALGWAFAIGRIGAIIGPIVGGLIIDLHIDMRNIFLIAAIPFLTGVMGSLALGRAYRLMSVNRADLREQFGGVAHLHKKAA